MSSSCTNRDVSESRADDAPRSILLSMKNDLFKSIIYRHFRILGKKHNKNNDDKDEEDVEARRVLEELIQNVGNGDHELLFYMQAKGDRHLHVPREKALEFIRHVMKNRDKTSHLWLPHDQNCKNSMSVDGGSGAVEIDVPAENDNHFEETLKQSQSSSASGENKSHRERVAKTSIIDSSSSVIPITRQSSRNPLKSTKRESDDDDETLASLAAAKRKTLRMHHVSTTNTTRKEIKPDLIVLDLGKNVKYARIMYKYYNILGLERNEARENQIADQVLKELKQNFNFFERFLDGERVEVNDDDIVRNLILEGIRRREECRRLWFDDKVSKSDTGIDVTIQTRPRRYSVLDTASKLKPTSRQKFLRKRKASTSSPRHNIPDSTKKLPSKPSEIKKRTRTNEAASRNPIFSPLNCRLPPRKLVTITSHSPIETVSQLVQIVQLVTHKLNELHGTARRHCRVIRLHHLAEFGGVRSGVPTLAELAAYMGTTEDDIRKWCRMYLLAEKRGFDFEAYSDDKLDLHSSMFERRKGEDGMLLVRECGKMAMDRYFDQIAQDVFKEIGDNDVIDMAEDGSRDKASDLEDKVEGEIKTDMAAETGVIAHETQIHHKEESVMNSADEKRPLVAEEKSKVEERAPEENSHAQHDACQPDNRLRNDRVDGYVSQKENSLNGGDASDVSNRTSLTEEFSLHRVSAESFSASKENDAENLSMPGVRLPDTGALDDGDQMSSLDPEDYEYKVSKATMTAYDHEVTTKDLDRNAEDKAEPSNANSSEPPLIHLDISEDDVPDVLNTQVIEDVNYSYIEVKLSIAKISDAIGSRMELENAIVPRVGDGKRESDQSNEAVGSLMNSQNGLSSAAALESSIDKGDKESDEPCLCDSSQHPRVANRGSVDDDVSDSSKFQKTEIEEEVNITPHEITKHDYGARGNTDKAEATRIVDNTVMERANLLQRSDLAPFNALDINVSPATVNPRQSVNVPDANMPDSRRHNDNAHLLRKIKRGSRVFVKWGRDHDLFKATVIKVLFDRGGAALKVHYDGKKRHIVDKVRFEMIEGFIGDDDKHSQQKGSRHTYDKERSEKAAFIKELLHDKYPSILPFGKLEHREQCPELGPGWTIYIAARRNKPASQHGNRIRADRYFISPSGKSCRSISALENYFLEHSNEFELSSTENEFAETYHNKHIHIVDHDSIPYPGDGQNKTSSPEHGTRLETDDGPEELRGFSPRYRRDDRQRSSAISCKDSGTHKCGTDNSSMLIMDHSAHAVENSVGDHEFLTSPTDEKSFLFGDEGTEGEHSSLSCGHSEELNIAAADSIDACSLKPMKSCVKCPAPDPKREVEDHYSLKKVVHSAREESDAPQQETIAPQDGDKKKGLSPRMKHNKKSLIAGIVPVFAMDIPVGAEFAGYLDDAHRDGDIDEESDEEVSSISRTSRTDADDSVTKNTSPCQLGNQVDIKQHSAISQLSPKVSPITVRKPSNFSSFLRISPISFIRNKNKDIDTSNLNRGLQDSESGCVALPSCGGSPKGNGPTVTANSTDDLDGSVQGTFPRPRVEEPKYSEVEDSELGEDSQHKNAMQLTLDKPLSKLKCTSSPNDVVVINVKPTHSAFVAVPRVTRPGLAPPVFQSSSSLRNNVLSESRKAGNVQLFAFKYDSEEAEKSAARPKRKLKCIVRFDPDMTDTQANVCKTGHGFVCPRCKYVCEYDSKLCTGCQLECYYEAGVGVVVLKERASIVADQTTIPMEKKPYASLSAHVRPEGVLCNCTYCGRHHFSIQGIYAHHGRSHQLHGKLDWSNVTFSCPFCKSSEVFTLEEAERHVREHHPGSELVTPNTLRLTRNRSRSKAADSPSHSSLHPNKLRITRTKKTPHERNAGSHVSSHKVTPKWTTLDYRRLFPDCKKDYPRDICNILDRVDDQCKAQEELLDSARAQRLKLCRAEAEMEAKAWEDDRLAYQRGIRERSRYADGERIEKQKFVESHKLRLMQYEYENRNRKRSRNEVEAEKLCLKPVVFESGKSRNLPQERVLCNDEQCELCKNDSNYLQSVMLDAEMTSFRKDNTSSQSLHPAVNLLNPSFREISEHYFSEAEQIFEAKAEVAKSIGGKHEGNRKANNSRRDIATSKRLRIEEDKLFKMKRIQHGLLFVKKYNEGLITFAWNENKNEKRR